MLAQIVIDSNHKLDESGNCADQNDHTGGINNAQEQPPVAFAWEWYAFQGAAKKEREPDAREHEEAERRHLYRQTDQDYVLPSRLLSGGVGAGKHSSTDDLHEEGEDIAADEHGSYVARWEPEVFGALELRRYDPDHYPPKSLIAGRCHDGRGDQDENCLNDEDRSIVERFDTDSARDIAHELHWE